METEKQLTTEFNTAIYFRKKVKFVLKFQIPNIYSCYHIVLNGS
jgi:hypothetical protein